MIVVCPFWVESGHSTTQPTAPVVDVRYGWKADVPLAVTGFDPEPRTGFRAERVPDSGSRFVSRLDGEASRVSFGR